MVKSDVQLVKIATQIARLHICISLLQVHGPTWHPPPHTVELGACQGQSRNCSLVVECPLTPLFHLLSPEPLSLRIGQSCWHHPVQWCDTYALSGWSLFTCQCTRVSCYGRNDGHEARRQEGEHTDSHNTNSTRALSSPYLCTINFF